MISGTLLGVIKGDTRSVDYSSFDSDSDGELVLRIDSAGTSSVGLCPWQELQP